MAYSLTDNPGLIKVLSFLKTHNTEYLSGQDLSDVLKISRVAVWKHIKKIKELGYKVESIQKQGYRLVSNTKLLLPWEIAEGLETSKFGKKIFYFDSIGSTQDHAMKMAQEVNNDGAVIIARRQTLGKGRNGRKWISPKGGIWISIILNPRFDISVITLFPIAASLALSYAMEKCFKIKPELKWPNDVTLRGKKVSGVLVDASLESNKIENIVLGVGINFDIKVKDLEKELRGTPNFYGVASLTKFKKSISPVKFVQVVLVELENIIELLNSQNVKKITKEWTKRSSTIGKNVKMKTKEGMLTGKALRIDSDGALVIRDKKNFRILAGDIVHL